MYITPEEFDLLRSASQHASRRAEALVGASDRLRVLTTTDGEVCVVILDKNLGKATRDELVKCCQVYAGTEAGAIRRGTREFKETMLFKPKR